MPEPAGAGKKPHGDRRAGMETDPCEFEGLGDRLFQGASRVTERPLQLWKTYAIDRLDAKSAKLTCGIFATEWSWKPLICQVVEAEFK